MKNTNLRRSALLTVCAVVITAIGIACEPKVETPKAAPPPATSPAASPAANPATSPAADKKEDDKKRTGAEAKVGRWQGLEGTYLNVVESGPDTYTVEIKDLDGAKQYQAKASGDGLEFTREGKTQTVKAATGTETGMKGFEKETNCLVITKGSEGFCRK